MARLGAIDNPPKTPTILGFECAGEVEAIGEGVEDFQVNKTKFAFLPLFDSLPFTRLAIVLLLCPNSAHGLNFALFQRNTSTRFPMKSHSMMLPQSQ